MTTKPDRDNKGKFSKGHRYYKPQNGNRSGRKKLPSTEVKSWLSEHAPMALQQLYKLCEDGDRAACEYICDRQWGRSPASLDLTSKEPINVKWVVGKGYDDSSTSRD